jgi:hypothetical protein
VITTFDVPGAVSGPNLGTMPAAINDGGAIIGWFDSATDRVYGFVRSASGVISTFGNPWTHQTIANCVNNAGVIAGSYWQDDQVQVRHGFVVLL